MFSAGVTLRCAGTSCYLAIWYLAEGSPAASGTLPGLKRLAFTLKLAAVGERVMDERGGTRCSSKLQPDHCLSVGLALPSVHRNAVFTLSLSVLGCSDMVSANPQQAAALVPK